MVRQQLQQWDWHARVMLDGPAEGGRFGERQSHIQAYQDQQGTGEEGQTPSPVE